MAGGEKGRESVDHLQQGEPKAPESCVTLQIVRFWHGQNFKTGAGHSKQVKIKEKLILRDDVRGL